MSYKDRYRLENAKAFRRALMIERIADIILSFVIIFCIFLFILGVGVVDEHVIAGLLMITFSFLVIAGICMLKDPDLLIED